MDDTTQEVRQRALEFQRLGPDEFPFGYYVYLAKEELNGRSA